MSEFELPTYADPAIKLRTTSSIDASESRLGDFPADVSPTGCEKAQALYLAHDNLPSEEKYSKSRQYSISDSVKLVVSIALSFLVSWATTLVVAAEYHYGYEVVQRLLGKTDDSVQWIFAIGLLLLCGLLGFALTFGFLKSHFRGSSHWNFVAIPVFFVCTLINDSGLRLSLDDLIVVSIAALLLLPVVLCGASFGSKFWSALSRRVDPMRILGPGIVAILCIGLLSGLTTSWYFEIAKDAVGILAASLASAALVRREELSSKIVAATLSCLPFLLFDLINVALNVVLICACAIFGLPGLWDEANRALLSSLSILFVCISGIASGVVLSHSWHARQHRVSVKHR